LTVAPLPLREYGDRRGWESRSVVADTERTTDMDPKLLAFAPDRLPSVASDRELLEAILNVVAGLAERVTGERVEVLVTFRDGSRAWVLPNALLGVRWTPRSEEASGRVEIPLEPDRKSSAHPPPFGDSPLSPS
jgi:hypothetical protein